MSYSSLHTYSVCAYRKSRYLEACIKSLIQQTMPSNIILCTSTPNSWIRHISQKYNIRLYVRNGESNIRDDWNYAFNQADTPYVTLVHQDDLYRRDYTEAFLRHLQASRGEFSIYFTGYRPLKKNKISTDANCIIRAFLRIPYKTQIVSRSKSLRKYPLALGNSICCPTVTYNKRILGDHVFTSNLKFNIDWDTFFKLSKLDYPFAYNPSSLVFYRIHEDATSMTFINNHDRIVEDTLMFKKFWPPKLASLLMHFYTKAYDTYK